MAADETPGVAARLRGIYVIINDGERSLDVADAALRAGVRIFQYRAKSGIDRARLRALRERTRRDRALLIVNDDWRAAREFQCDGVHLGPDDDGFNAVSRVRAGFPGAIVGLSCGTEAEARMASIAGAAYIGVGAVYATGSKNDAGLPIGIDGLKRVAAATSLPVAAIGGISETHLADIRATGVAMAAVISAVSAAEDPYSAAERLVRAW